MRVLVICDLEEREFDLGLLDDPALRLIVSCGDVYNRTYEAILAATDLPIFAVHGNHDDAVWPSGITDLHMSPAEHEGVTLGGFEGAWKYKPKGRFLYEDEYVTQTLRWFPQVDVFVAHNPIAGIHDIQDGVHNGFTGFLKYIERTSPKYFLHGHSNRKGEAVLGETKVICVSEWLKLEIGSGGKSKPP